MNFDESDTKTQELLILTRIESLYWKAWEITHNEVYLEGIEFCVDQRAKILGLQVPENFIPGQIDNGIYTQTISSS